MKVQVIINSNEEALGIPGAPTVTPAADTVATQTAWNQAVEQLARDHGLTVEQLADEAGIDINQLGLEEVIYVDGIGAELRRWVVTTS